ncbi:MAG: hypothetical protein R3240_00470 [Gammaproteobacteria bacterium]|nr:hypothetical protein [Gammaproteobacteria bacterium]
MGVKLQRGNIQELMPADKKGASTCRVDERVVKLPRDLVDGVKNGDKVEIAGVIRKQVLHAMAINDISQSKVSGVDCTNSILLMGAGWLLFIMFGVFSLHSHMSNTQIYLEALQEVVTVGGLLLALFCTRNFVQVIRSVNRVS